MSPFLKTALFTVVVPGSFAVLIPLLIAGDRVAFSLFIRLYEEPRLTREFGDEYVAYMKRVGRWLSLPGRRV